MLSCLEKDHQICQTDLEMNKHAWVKFKLRGHLWGIESSNSGCRRKLIFHL